MGETRWESSAAWRELLDGLRDLDHTFLAGDKAVRGEQAVAEGYRFLATILGVALDIHLFADPERPRFCDINTPWRADLRWGGDNTDAYYAFVPIDPERTYRVHGTRGDSVYFSFTVYNEPAPGQWSDRVVGIIGDADLRLDGDGGFEFLVGRSRPDGYDGPFLEIDGGAAAAVTRDYQLDPTTGRRVQWQIEALDPPGPPGRTDGGTARALRAVRRWVEEMFGIVPLAVAPREDRTTLGHNSPVGANVCAAPYQVGDANYGWSARDACYSFGSFSLAPDEALVVTHRPPDCRFWNVVVWNPYMARFDGADERTSVNLGSAVPNADGSVTVVIAQEPLEHPNAISTIRHPEGVIAFRWFHAAEVPETPSVAVIAAADAPRATT